MNLRKIKESLERCSEVHETLEKVKGGQYLDAVSSITALTSFLTVLRASDAPSAVMEAYRMVMGKAMDTLIDSAYNARKAAVPETTPEDFCNEMMVDSETLMNTIVIGKD